MKILLAAILGAMAMFLWTSIAHMALPLGEAGIGEIPNESAVLSAMQSSIGDQTGLYIFPGLGVGKNASRQEKNEAMRHMNEKIAANPSGILMYHAPGRPFTLGKLLGIEFATELLEAILVVFLLAQTRIASFAGRVGFVLVAGILAAIGTNVSYWNLVRFSRRLHRQLHAYPGGRLSLRQHRRGVGSAEELSPHRTLRLFCKRCSDLLRGCHAVLLPTANEGGRFR
jgi:hypothetical protein